MLDLDEHQYSLSPTDFNLIFSQIDHSSFLQQQHGVGLGAAAGVGCVNSGR